jgi:hypothetical protein
MSKCDESTTFLYDVGFNVYALLCGYCKAIKDKNPKCQTLMKVMHFCVMLVLVYVL